MIKTFLRTLDRNGPLGDIGLNVNRTLIGMSEKDCKIQLDSAG
jgi:hypothetical protein